MKRPVKWIISGSAALGLAGLAALQWPVLQAISHRPKTASSVRISVSPVFSPGMTSDTEMSAGEAAVKKHLESLLASDEPTHRLVYDEIKTMTGRLVKEHPDYVVFAQKYGDSGEMSVQLPRSRVVRLETCAAPKPVISRRDVRFYMEFPSKQFYKSPPYTILTEESFFAVEHIITQQQKLYAQFIEWFNPLVAASSRRDDVQLLIFSDTGEYSAYRDRYASELKGSSGFYSLGMDRMAVYHQREADWVKDGKKQITAVEKQYEGKLRTEQARESFSQWKNSAHGQLLSQANEATREVIRHEGAHQLFFTMGVQHPLQKGHGWVTEGLATFCETEKIGQINSGRTDELKAALAGGKLIPMRQLMAFSRCENPLAYAEAWALTYMLMQPEYRSGFFAYLDWLRTNPAVSAGDPVEDLCRFLAIQSGELEPRWAACINRLTLK